MRLGTLVPHFGTYASRQMVVEGAVRAEQAALRSFWARDHLLWTPHGMEGHDRTFLSPFLALAAISAVTKGCRLGTAVAIPVRSPLKLAQNYLSLAQLNAGRVTAGLGLGFDDREFRAVGLPADRKEAILTETVAVIRAAAAGLAVESDGEIFQLGGCDLGSEMAAPIELIYGGDSQKAVRRSLELADGWLPSRIPMDVLRRRLAYRDSLLETSPAQHRPRLVVQPLTVVARSSGEATSRVPFVDLATSVSGSGVWPEDVRNGRAGIEAFKGVVVCGNPEDVAEQIVEYADLGVDEFIFDLRLQYDRYFETLDLIGSEVVPRLASAGITEPDNEP